MNATSDLLRGELERLFELDEMKQLTNDYLGLDPETVGGTSGKGAFARALVSFCEQEDALEALADAILLVRKGDAGSSIDKVYTEGDEELSPGSQIGGYKVQKKLGRGGIGTVYLAEQKENGARERLAIKVVDRRLARDRAAVRRYLTVLRALRGLSAPGLAPILAVGQLEDGRPWVATKFIEGQTLAARVGRVGPMHFNEARPVFQGVLSTLGELHGRGMLHGDIKTENVFLVRPTREDGSKGEPTGVLVDGGVDRLLARPQAGGGAWFSVYGTPKALDPTVARGQGATPASDLYAAAATLYEVVAGRPPFTGDSGIDVVAQHLTAEPEEPSKHAPRGWISSELDAVLLKALAKNPKERYPNAAAFAEALDGVAKAGKKKEPTAKLDQGAFDKAKDALLAAPNDDSLAAELEKVVEPALAWSKAVEVLLEAAEKAEGDEKKALLFRAGRIQDAEIEDAEAAEASYRKVLELDAEDEVAQIAIEELKRNSGAHEELAELLLEKAEREENPTDRAAILREIAQIYEEKLESPENAFFGWVQALADDPTDERSVREVERLAANPEQWNDAITTLSEAAQEAGQSPEGVALYGILGRWYGSRLQRPDFAIQCFGQALAIDPSNGEAFRGMTELYRKSQSWKELQAVLLQRADSETNPAAARDYRAEAADITYRKLSDKDQAATLFAQVIADDPAHPKATETLELIYSEKKQWAELVNLLEGRSTNERGEQRTSTELRIAEIYEDRLSKIEKAEVQYESILAREATNLEALKGLERIYARRGTYDKLLANLEKQLEVAATPRQKIALHERIGGIQEEEFVDHEKAAQAFEAIIEVEPGHDAANTALARLYRQLNRFDDLVETLDRHAKSTEDTERKIGLLLAASKVLMVDVGAPTRATEFCERVLSVAPEHSEALETLARLKTSAGDTDAAIASIERLAGAEKDPHKSANLWVKAARLLEDAGDNDGAIARYKRALDVDKDNTDAAAGLRTLYSSRGDAHAAVELIRKEIENTDGEMSKAKLYAEMGTLYRRRLESPEEAKVAFQKALELDPTNTAAAGGLGGMAFDAGNYKESVKWYEPLLNRFSELPDGVAEVVCVRTGDAFRELGELDKAQRCYLNAKAFAPESREILERVADVTYRGGEADEAAELYRDIYQKFGKEISGEEKGMIALRLGDSLRKAKSYDDAIVYLNEASDLMPASPEPLGALASVYEDQGKWDQTVRTLRRRMDQAGDDERFRLLVRVGEILLDKMGDRAKASKSFVAALDIKPDDRNLLTKLMAVYSESKDWGRLVEIILRIADLVNDPKQLAKYYNTAGAISHRELKRFDEATDYYEQALENDPSLQVAFDGLVECLSQRREYAALAEAYRKHLKRLGKDAPPERRASLWDSLGEVLENQLNNLREAVQAYEEAQELDPQNRQRAEKLADIYAGEPKAYFSKAVETHATLLQMSPYRVESYQALRRLYTEMKRPDESWCLSQALTVLSMAEPDEESFFKKHRSRKAAAAQEFFNEEMWFNNVLHPTQDPLLTSIFGEITQAVVAVRAQALSAFKLDESKKRDPANDQAAMAQTLAYAAGVTKIELPPVYYREDDPGGLSFLSTNPPAIGLGKGALAGGPAQALAFVAGRHLAYFRRGLYLRHLIPTGSGLRAWLLAAIKIAQPQFPVPGDLQTPVSEHLAGLQSNLTAQGKDEVQSLVQKLLAASPSLDMKKWVAAVDLTVDRVGFILANDLEIATAVVKASPEGSAGLSNKERLKELYLYSVSPEYLQLRQKLGISIGG
ncbi:MAG: tetratricopeptide repeat protein [Myxococcota bacterium]